MSDGSDPIARRDEMLELLYWLEGESLVGTATVETMSRFLACDEGEVRATLSALVARGDIELMDPTREFKLTEVGRREAARRFADEFAELLGQGHGECNDPTCDCHTNLAAAADCHAAKAGRHTN